MRTTDCRKVNEVTSNIDPMIFNELQQFRQTLYDSLGNARGALFDLMDAVLVNACIASFVSLSQRPLFRRQWSSTYAALRDSRLPRSTLLKVLVADSYPAASDGRDCGRLAAAGCLQWCVYGAPPAYRGRGALAQHGHKMKLNDPETWSVPVETVEVDDPNGDECG